MRITVTTQAELDALPDKFDECTWIYIKSTQKIIVRKARENSSVVAWGNSSVEARENSSVEAWGNSSVEAWGNSSVVAWENSSVVARGNSSVVARENSSVVAWGNSSVVALGNSSVVAWGNSSVVARGNSSVVAWGNSSVEARGNSSVEAWENSSVEALGNSSVVARENSSVVAWGNSSVVARGNSSVVAGGNSSVVAWGNSSVVAWGNSSVVAWGNSCIRCQSESCDIALRGFAVLFLLVKKTKVKLKSKTATIIKPTSPVGTDAWLKSQGIEPKKSVILFKRVSADHKTMESTEHETSWIIGTTLTHPNWEPKTGECGAGKFHACSRPYFCDEFRSEKGDRCIAIEVDKADLYVWPDAQYPHKIAFKKGTVLYECDRSGKEVK
jgi:alpha-tubulin suppressor-like RCC1 family protein